MALAWQAYKRIAGLPLVLTLDNGLLFYADPRAGNSTAAIYTKIYESRYIQFVRQHCVQGGTIIDVGAHTGIYTLLLAKLFVAGLCFEPAQDTFSILVKNLTLNQLNRFEARPQAVSSTCGHGTLVAGQDFDGTAALSSESVGPGHRWEVELTTIDSVLSKWPMEITFLKIDTEGHETEVLLGASETLARSVRALILFENHDSGREAGVAHLRTLGFRCFAVSSTGDPELISHAKEKPYNILACGPAHPLHSRLG